MATLTDPTLDMLAAVQVLMMHVHFAGARVADRRGVVLTLERLERIERYLINRTLRA